jgi:signal peptidase I
MSKGTQSMQPHDATTAAGDLARDFTYEEKPRISPAWQLAIDIGETLILTVLMFLVIRFAVQDFQVDGTSMLPTLQNNQFVLVDKLTYDFGSPQRGDIIVFEYPLDHTKNYIKRVIGIPGDFVNVDASGKVSVNGDVLNEPYVNDLDNFYGPRSMTLGPNEYYVLGDNRGGSSDSRDWGPVNRSEIIGKASLVYWPAANFHFLPNEHGIFSGVPSSNVPLTVPATANVTLLERPVSPLSALVVLGALPTSAALVGQQRRRRIRRRARRK